MASISCRNLMNKSINQAGAGGRDFTRTKGLIWPLDEASGGQRREKCGTHKGAGREATTAAALGSWSKTPRIIEPQSWEESCRSSLSNLLLKTAAAVKWGGPTVCQEPC